MTVSKGQTIDANKQWQAKAMAVHEGKNVLSGLYIPPKEWDRTPPSVQVIIIALWQENQVLKQQVVALQEQMATPQGEERNEGLDLPSVWRFRLEDPRTGQRRGFVSPAELISCLQAKLVDRVDE